MSLKRINITNRNIINKEPRGFLPKNWIDYNGNRLVKYNHNIYPDQDIMEYLAAEIHNILEIESVKVNLIHHDEYGEGCMIKSFLNENEILLDSDTNRKISLSNNINSDISRCVFHVYSLFDTLVNASLKEIQKMRKDYLRLTLVDILLENPDRKLRNIGIIYNEETYKSKLVPAYDNGLIYSNYTSELEPVISVSNYHFDRSDVLNFLIKYHYEDIKDIVIRFINNFDKIINLVDSLQLEINEEKYTYIINSLNNTYKYLNNEKELKL